MKQLYESDQTRIYLCSFGIVEIGNNLPTHRKGMLVIQSIVISDTGYFTMRICTSQFFRRNNFTRCGFYQLFSPVCRVKQLVRKILVTTTIISGTTDK